MLGDVGNGSEADIRRRLNVRFTPKSEHSCASQRTYRKRSSAKQVGSWLFFAPKACHEKIARNAFAHPVLNSYIVMSCPKEIEGVGQCVIKALYLIKGLGA